ncbi:hypothetical protein [Nocardioides pelophilus]|uniref:hypothetical protein n=1 Tax=Nocardioides pelophilus TaxID=2172019 RepID=UPI001600A94F|nr:hypothetical protein [Nocardioides pelophilus]
MNPWHLGTLHPIEQALTVVLAFGPFVLLGIVVLVRRRQDAREEAAERAESAEREVADRTPEA